MLHRLLEQSEEKQATSLRTAAIESESELVEIVVEMVGIDGTMVDAELYPKVDGAVKSCWPMACLYRSLRFGEEYLPVSALLVDKT